MAKSHVRAYNYGDDGYDDNDIDSCYTNVIGVKG